MEIIKKILTDAYLFKINSIKESRGSFCVLYNSSEYNNIIDKPTTFIQDNLSISKKNVFRGFHFQTNQFSQSKLVTVLKGGVLDIIIDLRPESNTFMNSYSINLNTFNNYQLYIPKGFAHGFLSLEDETIFQYKVDTPYMPNYDSGINPADPFFKQLPINLKELIISKKDMDLPFIKDLDFNIIWDYITV